MKSIHRTVRFLKADPGSSETCSTRLAIESDVTLSVNGNYWLEFHCSPDALDALAAGFLFNEGFVESIEDIADLKVCDNANHVDVWLNHPLDQKVNWTRGSDCYNGTQPQQQTAPIKLPADICYSLTEVYTQLGVFHAVLGKLSVDKHGIHTSMLLDGKSEIQVICDIGRHNTLDKLAGFYLLRDLTLSRPVLLTTGRISSDMVRKAARMKIPLVISLHSISERAEKTAGILGITLIGNVRQGQMNIFTHLERILQIKDRRDR